MSTEVDLADGLVIWMVQLWFWFPVRLLTHLSKVYVKTKPWHIKNIFIKINNDIPT